MSCIVFGVTSCIRRSAQFHIDTNFIHNFFFCCRRCESCMRAFMPLKTKGLFPCKTSFADCLGKTHLRQLESVRRWEHRCFSQMRYSITPHCKLYVYYSSLFSTTEIRQYVEMITRSSISWPFTSASCSFCSRYLINMRKNSRRFSLTIK